MGKQVTKKSQAPKASASSTCGCGCLPVSKK